MKIQIAIYCRIIAFFIVAMVLVSGYLPETCKAQTSNVESLDNIKKIGVLPFLKGRYGNEVRATLDANISNFNYKPEVISEEADRILTGIVHEEIKGKGVSDVVPLLEAVIAYDSISKEGETIRSLAKKVGETLKVDTMVVGYIWRYKRRVGSSVSASSPASVGFCVCLVDVSTGNVLWKGSYEETQRSLSENILNIKAFFKKGAKWLTAEDLARYGVKDIFKKYPH
ncbi:hypothetical protein ACFL1N_02900 [Thermodesulfobacteriota bacterium]